MFPFIKNGRIENFRKKLILLGEILLRWLLCLLLAVASGCSLTKSRYAMDDPIYAEKYQNGAKRGDLLGKAKQAMDARHTDGLTGLYVSGGAQVRPDSEDAMGGVDLGVHIDD